MNAVQLGSRTSVVQIKVSQSSTQSVSQNSESGRVTSVIAMVTQGNLATEKGPSMPTPPTIPKDEIPDLEKDCEDFSETPLFRKFAPASTKVISKALIGRGQEAFEGYLGRSNREYWRKCNDGSNWDVLKLGYLTDAVSLNQTIPFKANNDRIL